MSKWRLARRLGREQRRGGTAVLSENGWHGQDRCPDGDGRRRVLPEDQYQHSDTDNRGFQYPPVAGQPELPRLGLACSRPSR